MLKNKEIDDVYTLLNPILKNSQNAMPIIKSNNPLKAGKKMYKELSKLFKTVGDKFKFSILKIDKNNIDENKKKLFYNKKNIYNFVVKEKILKNKKKEEGLNVLYDVKMLKTTKNNLELNKKKTFDVFKTVYEGGAPTDTRTPFDSNNNNNNNNKHDRNDINLDTDANNKISWMLPYP